MKKNEYGISWMDQYRFLTQNIKKAQKNLDAVTKDVISFHGETYSEIQDMKNDTCINLYACFDYPCLVTFCDYMKNGELCTKKECSMYSDNVKYINVQKRLSAAYNARREFIKKSVKGIFR